MIADFFKLSLALVLGFFVWAVYQHRQWDEDYTRYQAPSLTFPLPDTTFEEKINPALFKKAVVITNDTNLRYPEDIAVSNNGIIYTGLCDGSIVWVTPASNQTTTLFQHNDSGIIFGIIITSDDTTLYYLTQFRGLVKLDIATKTPTYLLSSYNNKKVGALNSVAIDQSRQILYITESSPIRMAFSNKEVLLKHSKGRIFSLHLATLTIQVVLENIAFPNGIVYQQSSNSIIFSELTRYTIWRYNLNSGTKQAIIQNLFGYGDNLKLNQQGQLLVGIPATRDLFLQFLNSKPDIRKLIMYLPQRVIYALTKRRAGGIKIDTHTGEIVQYLFGAPTKTSFITTVLQKNGKTYFSSLGSPTILVLDNTQTSQTETPEIVKNEL